MLLLSGKSFDLTIYFHKCLFTEGLSSVMYLKLLIRLFVKVIFCLVTFKVAKYELDKLKKQISGVTKDLPLDVLDTISRPLTDVHDSISKYSPEIEKSSQIRYFHKTYFP